MAAAIIVDQLEALDVRFPGRFTPAGVLVEQARSHGRFYPASGHPLP
jgi:hypothetical protein